MPAVTCLGIDMYDMRTSLKVEAAEEILMGESCYIHTDGLAYVVDDGKSDVVHGWALKYAADGDLVTLVTQCRMKVETAQTIGARLYTGAIAGGSAPSTTHAASGVVCGYSVTAYLIYCNVPTPAADG